jgi:hypothetical protein
MVLLATAANEGGRLASSAAKLAAWALKDTSARRQAAADVEVLSQAIFRFRAIRQAYFRLPPVVRPYTSNFLLLFKSRCAQHDLQTGGSVVMKKR